MDPTIVLPNPTNSTSLSGGSNDESLTLVLSRWHSGGGSRDSLSELSADSSSQPEPPLLLSSLGTLLLCLRRDEPSADGLSAGSSPSTGVAEKRCSPLRSSGKKSATTPAVAAESAAVGDGVSEGAFAARYAGDRAATASVTSSASCSRRGGKTLITVTFLQQKVGHHPCDGCS